MKKETLSDKIMYLDEEKGFSFEDVREFIQKLKVELGGYVLLERNAIVFRDNVFNEIDKLAGEELTK